MPRKFGELPDGAPIPTRFEVAAARQHDAARPHAGAARQGRPRPTLADYRSSRRRSWYLLALLTATVGFSTLSLAMLQTNGGPMGLAIRLMQRDLSLVGSIVAVSLVGLVLTLATAIAWFVWFDRVLQNVPPLTGRWTEQGRAAAVTWWLVPLVGLFRGPYVVGQVYDRVRVRTGPGLWLLGLWATFWLGGTIAPYIASWLVGFLPLDLLTLVQLQNLISVMGQVSYVVAGLFAATLVLAFEHAQEARTSGATDLEPVRDDEDRPQGAFELAPAHHGAQVGLVQGTTGAGWPADPNGARSGAWASAPGHPNPASGDAWAAPSGSPGSASQEAWAASGTSSAQWAFRQVPPTADPTPVPAPTPIAGPTPGGPVAVGDRYMVGVIPAIPLAVMVGAIAVGLMAGVMLGHAARPTDAFAATEPDTAAAATDLRRRTFVAVPGPALSATPQQTPGPFAPAAVAREVVQMFVSDDYRGGMAVRATLANDDGTASSTLDVMRSGDREWSEFHVGTTTGAASEDLERVVLGSVVWERTDTTDWDSRDRSGHDRPTPPLLGLTDPDDLEYVGVWPEGETSLHAFRWPNRMTLMERSLTARFGVRDAIRTAGTLLVTEAGEPVRSLLSYTGVADGQQVRLDMVIEFQDVMARIVIRSPREGPPALVRSP